MIIHNKPPIYERLSKQFGVEWDNGVIITYYPHIYYKYELSKFKIIHEEVHLRQQSSFKGGIDAWWDEYCSNPQFRLKQELEAYGAEVKYIRKKIKNIPEREKYMQHIADSLGGSMYGNIIKPKEVLEYFNKN